MPSARRIGSLLGPALIAMSFTVPIYVLFTVPPGPAVAEAPQPANASQRDSGADADLAGLQARVVNDAVDWEIDHEGQMVPHFRNDSVELCSAAGDKTIPVLLSALESPTQFAAAHVLLCILLERQRCCFTRTDSGFDVMNDQLEIQIRFRKRGAVVTKSVEFPNAADQRQFLRRHWTTVIEWRDRQRRQHSHSVPLTDRTSISSGAPPVRIGDAELDRIRSLIRNFNERDVTWVANSSYAGPKFSDGIQSALRSIDPRLTDELLTALDDNRKTISMHLLLTSVKNPEQIAIRPQAAGDHGITINYNNLTVYLKSTDDWNNPPDVVYPNADLEKHWLRYMWRAKMTTWR